MTSPAQRPSRPRWTLDGMDPYRATAVVFGVVYAAAGLAATYADTEARLFGVSQMSATAWAALAIAVVAGASLAVRSGLQRIAEGPRSRAGRLVAALVSGWVFYFLRSGFLNPDGRALAAKFAEDIPLRGAHVTHDEMWELWVHSKAWLLTNAWFGWTVEYTYQVVSCLGGAVFVYLLLTYCSTIVPRLGGWAFALCVSGGYMQLFFGDVENYTLMSMWMMAYFLAALNSLENRTSVIPASVLLAVAMTFHLEAGFLVPSWLYLLLVSWRRSAIPHAVIGGLSLVAVVAGTLGFFDSHGLPIGALFVDSHALAHGGRLDTVLVEPSMTYYFEIFNLLLLLVPGSVLLPFLLCTRRVRLDPINVHLLLASAFLMILLVAWRADLGVYNDWNLFASLGIPVSLLVWRSVLSDSGLENHLAPLLVLNALFMAHSMSWIVSNHAL